MQRTDESIRAHLFVDIDLAELPQRFLIMMRFTYADAVKASTELEGLHHEPATSL